MRQQADSSIAIAIAGLGKIARDQHVPALRADPRFRLVATASPYDSLDGVPSWRSLAELLAAGPAPDAVAVCTTPQARFEVASAALAAGCHVLLEKPPCVLPAQVEALVALAAARGSTLHAAWHSRHADGVQPAREWLAGRAVRRVAVRWKENVLKWHPGQRWIWREGGMGVFDPGINALSILTSLLPGPLRVQSARLEVPANCEMPIAVQMVLAGPGGLHVECDFDFRHVEGECWDIDIHADGGLLQLRSGGDFLFVDGQAVPLAPGSEYPRVYAHFAGLVAARASDVDIEPLRIVTDALLAGERVACATFVDPAWPAGA